MIKMAITPKQAQEKARTSVKSAKQLEARIDKIIVDHLKNGDTDICIDTSFFSNTATQNYIIETYRNAGWHVKYESDQRDGDFLRFTPKKNYTKDYGLRPAELT